MPPLPAITDLSDDEPQQRGTVTTGKTGTAAPTRPPVADSPADLVEPAPKTKAKATSKAKAKAKSRPVTPKPKPAPKALKRPAAAKATVLKRPASEVRAYKYWCYKDKKIGIKLHGKEVTTV